MEIVIESLLEGAKRAAGTVVVIDVFRAFTTAAVVLSKGADKIVMVDRVEEAFALRAAGIGALCMGEIDGVKVEGFELGNSPYEASLADLAGTTVIQRTSSGTRGVAAALGNADRLFAGALVTASATTRAVLAEAPARVTLAAMGRNAVVRADEDELCAIHLRNLLEGRPGNADALRGVILGGGQIPDFADPAKPYLHPNDLDICLDVDRFDFAIRVALEDGRPVARPVRPD